VSTGFVMTVFMFISLLYNTVGSSKTSKLKFDER
jgi:hypothetical protein